ncbi:MAG TPA: DUF5667 domain-containing protein [Chloroflexota bacterium]
MGRDNELLDTLDRCIKLVEQGVSVEEALRRVPNANGEVEPLLRTVRALRGSTPPPFDPAARDRVRARLFAQMDETPAARLAHWLRWLPPRPMLVRAAGVLLALMAFGATSAVAVADALPGSPLYPLKLATEQVVLNLTLDPAARVNLRLNLAERRLSEAWELMESENAAGVDEAVEGYERLVTAARQEAPSLPPPVAEMVEERLQQQVGTLATVAERVPEPARDRVEQALERSRGGPAAEDKERQKLVQTEPEPPGVDRRERATSRGGREVAAVAGVPVQVDVPVGEWLARKTGGPGAGTGDERRAVERTTDEPKGVDPKVADASGAPESKKFDPVIASGSERGSGPPQHAARSATAPAVERLASRPDADRSATRGVSESDSHAAADDREAAARGTPAALKKLPDSTSVDRPSGRPAKAPKRDAP